MDLEEALPSIGLKESQPMLLSNTTQMQTESPDGIALW
jgi:hypothetical protein